MNTNFTVYRKGVAAFNLESRRQGQVRKVTSASFREEIMNDDCIKITLLSSVRMDFRLRDYIVYDGRPYVLNRLPEASIDATMRFTYTLTFEGVLYEMGRVALITPDAFGYEYYGTLPEFARLVIDNMNRVNEWIEWSYNGHSYAATYLYSFKYQGTTYHYWKNRSGNALNVNVLITTSRHPSVGDHGYNPIGGQQTSVVTAAHKWSLEFPHNTTEPTVYPIPGEHISGTDYITQWGQAVQEDHTPLVAAYEYVEKKNWSEDVEHYLDQIIADQYGALQWETPLDALQRLEPVFPPTIAGQVEIRYNKLTFKIRVRTYQWDSYNQVWQGPVTTKYETHTIDIAVRFTAETISQSEWQVDPITPPSGQATQNDYPTESKLLTYDGHSCLAVMQDIVTQEEWKDWEWRIKDNVEYGYVDGEILVCGVLKIQRREAIASSATPHILGYGRGGGLSLIKRKYSDGSNIPSRVYFYGGSQNLPEFYRNSRLCLPNKSKADSYINFAELVDTSFPLGISNTCCEEVRVIDDIYPASKPFVIGNSWTVAIIPSGGKSYLRLVIPKGEFFDIDAKWSNYTWPDPDRGISPNNPQDWIDYPDFCEWLVLTQLEDVWVGVEEVRVNRARYITYYAMKGVSKYLTGGESPMIAFQTGALAGYQLSIHSCEVSGDYIVLDLNVVKEDNEEVNDYYVPNSEKCCYAGDKFIIENINMPASYTYYNGGDQYDNNHELTHHDYSAEYALWKAALDYMASVAEKIDYEITVAREHVIKNGDKFRCFDAVRFNDVLSEGNPYVTKRISAVELDLVDGYSYKLTITNRGVIRPLSILGSIVSHNTQSDR
ncbi:MAG: hypothetical protein K6G25_06580 [Bacteroidales bacterium]|nr:hypothetical protein [Bacteroidales bacterium]